MQQPPRHTWIFFRVGGFDQVRLESGADLAALGELDQKLWTALACPTKGLEFDARTLALIDSDNDGRIRAPDIIAAARWATANPKNPDDLLRVAPTLPLAAINSEGDEGRQIIVSAKNILANLGKPDADVITLDDTATTAKLFAQQRFNGDGIVSAASAQDQNTTARITDIIKYLGAVTDRSGKPGIDQDTLDRFFQALHAYADWWAAGAAQPGVMPLGEHTAAAYAALAALRTTVITPLYGADKATLSAAEWEDIKSRFAPYQDWQAKKGGAVVEPLGIARVRVDDPARHAVLAAQSNAYLVYLDCTRHGKADKLGIVAAVTNGDADQLMVGRNGVFYDRQGQDWDATVVKIIENPIGLRQAAWAPYKRMARMIGEQIEKMAAAKDKVVSSKAAAGIQSATAQTDAAKPAPPPPFDVARFAGIFAAIGLAIGALGTALAAVITGFLSLAWWQIPLAFFGILLLISGPAVVLAWLKLRRRNLGRILDANGWAVNTRVKINTPFGHTLTVLAKLPPGARRSFADPYADQHHGRWLALALFFIAAGAVAYYLLKVKM